MMPPPEQIHTGSAPRTGGRSRGLPTGRDGGSQGPTCGLRQGGASLALEPSRAQILKLGLAVMSVKGNGRAPQGQAAPLGLGRGGEEGACIPPRAPHGWLRRRQPPRQVGASAVWASRHRPSAWCRPAGTAEEPSAPLPSSLHPPPSAPPTQGASHTLGPKSKNPS